MNTKFFTAKLGEHLGSKFHLSEAKTTFVHEAPGPPYNKSAPIPPSPKGEIIFQAPL